MIAVYASFCAGIDAASMPWMLASSVLVGLAVMLTVLALRALTIAAFERRRIARPHMAPAPPIARPASPAAPDGAAESSLLDLMRPLINVLALAFEGPRFDGLRDYIRKPYQKAGSPGAMTENEVVALALMVGVGVAVFLMVGLSAMLGGPALLFAPIGIPIGLLAVVSSLKARAEQRQRQISNGLPYAIDLLVLILRSGTSMTLALRQVVEDYQAHPLGDEFGRVLEEIELGISRRDAFARLEARLELDEMKALIDNIVQAEELGWPLAETLERLADRLATERLLRAQETAGRAGVMVMMPSTMILFAVMLILFGPVIVRAMRGGFAM